MNGHPVVHDNTVNLWTKSISWASWLAISVLASAVYVISWPAQMLMCFVNLVVYLFLLLSTGKGEFAKFIMFNPILFTRGSIHQGDCRSSDIFRGRQCAFMSLSPLLCANLCDKTWRASMSDNIKISLSGTWILIMLTCWTLYNDIHVVVLIIV